MNTTIMNYPGFQTLPKGLKQMLLVSEAHFFDQPARPPQEKRRAVQATITGRDLSVYFARPRLACAAC
jgi:hypothetical protein